MCTAGIPSFAAAARPRIPAFELCVWTISGLISRSIAISAIGLPILPRPDGSLQFGQHAKIETAVTSTLFETSFRSQAGAGDQRDFVAVVTMLILDGQQCVFLCSADDQSRDEMDDVHAEADGVSLGVARS